MKTRLLWLSCSLIVMAISPVAIADSDSDLQVKLSANKSACAVGDVIEFTEVLHNSSKNTIQLIDDQCGYGKDIRLSRVSDGKPINQCEGSGGGHTLKPGLRPGKRIFLKANQDYSRKFRAYLNSEHCLCFQNHGSAGFTGFSKGEANMHHLPAEFFGCGCMYALQTPGKFKVAATYENDYEWSTGELKPPEPLWKGRSTSNELTIKID